MILQQLLTMQHQQTAKIQKYYYKKPPSQAAFTLLELIVVIAVLGILAVYVQTKFQSDDSYQIDTATEQLINAARLTQQLAMNDSSRSFTLNVSSNQINISATPTAISLEGIPVSFGNKISLSPAANITFDSLGKTSSTTISINSSISVCFEASGLIHRC